MAANYRLAIIIASTFCILMFGLSAPSTVQAARCAVNSSGEANCSFESRIQTYSCNGIPFARRVRWQVPEGPPPQGGWPVAFFYQGTSPADTNPFKTQSFDSFGVNFQPKVFRELLDDPAQSGKKYAVIAPEPPQTAVLLEFWHTNLPIPYSTSCDYDYFPDLFKEIKQGKFGGASLYDMDRRFAFGISSGGYNSSRMAVTFNQNRKWYQSCDAWCNKDSWKALGVISASYATCSGPLCSVPNLPNNHPPTKFWQGSADIVVPEFTANRYYNKLIEEGIYTEIVRHNQGHEMTSHNLGTNGVKAWFDLFYH